MLMKLHIYLETCLSSGFTSIVWWPGMTCPVPTSSHNACCGSGAWCHSLSSGTSPFSDWQLADRKITFLLPSDVYVRSVLYLFHTLIKLYHIKPRHWIEFSSSGGQESRCLLWFSDLFSVAWSLSPERPRDEQRGTAPAPGFQPQGVLGSWTWPSWQGWCARPALKGRGADCRARGWLLRPAGHLGVCLLPRKLTTPLTPRFESTGRSIPRGPHWRQLISELGSGKHQPPSLRVGPLSPSSRPPAPVSWWVTVHSGLMELLLTPLTALWSGRFLLRVEARIRGGGLPPRLPT